MQTEILVAEFPNIWTSASLKQSTMGGEVSSDSWKLKAVDGGGGEGEVHRDETKK